MDTIEKTKITVEATINAPIDKVWEYWTKPEHITQWYQASEDWHAPYAENDLQENRKFKTTMAAKDGSLRFDFEGVYTKLQPHKLIEYTLNDGRQVRILFSGDDSQTKVIETFEAEDTHPLEMQQSGWQAILNSFKNYAEKNNTL
ncbi:SRPBCC family protein [Pontibacter sp. 172403-2]|uniref:SRPBCC family protein n=1 Tax=Pontibacter rufus TaxID=2791028 RepID=UPI0018AF8D20|nr:SRPBCC family protein [Pontibacter sp. 172403-2]MBF9253168.1 SRPBCC family protein [Pontibacter sp. 172403-2]